MGSGIGYAIEDAQVARDLRPEELMLHENLLIDKPNEDSFGFINVAYGRFYSSLYDLEQSSRTDSFYYKLKMSVNDVQGERQNAEFVSYRPSFELGIPFDQENEAVVKMYYFDTTMELPGRMDMVTTYSQRRNTDYEISGKLIHRFPSWKMVIEPYYGTSIMNEDLGREDFKHKVVGTRLESESDNVNVDFNIYQNTLTHHYEQTMADASIRWTPLELNDGWQVQLGIDAFAQENFGQRPSPFIEFLYKYSDTCLHKLKALRQVEPLVFNQTYIDANFIEVNTGELRPRRNSKISYEIDTYISDEWRANFEVYVRRDKDLWFWNDLDNDGFYSPALIEKVNFAGIRLSTEYSWSESFSHFLNLNIRSVQSKDANYEFIPYEPKQRISVGLTYKLFDQKGKFNIIGDYFGRRYLNGNSKESFSGYFLMSSKLTYELKDYLTLYVLVDNLLNDHYEVVKGYPNQSRSAMVGVMVNF